MKIDVKSKLNTIIRIVHLMRPRLRSYFTGLIIFTITEVTFYISIPIAVKVMIDAALKKDASMLWNGIFSIVGISVCGGISFVLFMYLFATTVVRITAGVRNRIFERALNLPAVYFEQNHSGNILSRITNDINMMGNAYDWPLWNALVTWFAGTGAAATMIILDWRVSLFLILTSILFTTLNSRFAAVIGKISREIQQGTGRLTESLGNILGGFPVIRQFHLEKKMQEEFEVHNSEILSRSMQKIKKSAWMSSYNFFIGWLNFGGILAAGAILASLNLIGFGTMVAMANLLWNVNRMINETGGYIAQFQGYLAGAERVIELHNENTEPDNDDSAEGMTEQPSIEIRDLAFSYDGRKNVLNGLNLHTEGGKNVALVGPSGGGKTTVFKLLLGFYQPGRGSIVIGGKKTDQFSLKELRDLIAYVPQEPFMFDGTIAENIAFGKKGAGFDEVVQAAEAANAHDFIRNMKEGYDTIVGERGIKLSGGQRQRIAIARAFLKTAPLLLLDEATSSLDSESERLIQEALRNLENKKSVIIIAHRLSTVEHADRIYVIDNGVVVEQGRHNDLLAQNGLYKKLYEIQYKLESSGHGES